MITLQILASHLIGPLLMKRPLVATIIIKVQASDPDSKDDLQYKILSGNEGRYFSINESSGLISFSNVCKRNLDPFYNLNVAVSDGCFRRLPLLTLTWQTSTSTAHILARIFMRQIRQRMQKWELVWFDWLHWPDDGPYGSVDYIIINKLADEKFSIDEGWTNCDFSVLDRENPSQRVIAIKVMAKDGGGRVGFCTVKIILTDWKW